MWLCAIQVVRWNPWGALKQTFTQACLAISVGRGGALVLMAEADCGPAAFILPVIRRGRPRKSGRAAGSIELDPGVDLVK